MSARPEAERWDRIASIFERALECHAGEQGELLDRLCGSDAALRREIEEMLAAHDTAHGLLAERRVASAEEGASALPGTLSPGSVVGPYRVQALIGSGGMSDVYRAERADGAYRQVVALKVLRPGYRTAEMVRRFRIEREALARLVHPGIAAILDGGTLEDGRPYLVMQLVDGLPITLYCERHGLGARDRLRLFMRVARAVQFAHGHLVVHRDLKPSNILVQPDGTPRLLDFGIAKLLHPGDEASLLLETAPEVRLLTPEYAAPEQLRGEPPGTATDVYALGVLLFELLTRARPFPGAGRTAARREMAILQTPPPAPSSVAPSRADARFLRGDLDRIVLMALRKEPERRYVSAGQMAEDVERFLAGRPVLARPDTLAYRGRRFVGRNRLLVGVGCAFALLLIGFALTAGAQARRIARERDRAERERASAEDVLGILTDLFERGNPARHPGGDTLRVTSLLDAAEQEVDRLGADPVRQANLWRAVARMRAARGEYARALQLLTRAYERRRRLFGPDDLDAARMHHEMARVLVSYRGESAARPVLDSSLRQLRRLLGDTHEEVRAAMGELLMATYDSMAANALRAQLLELERRAPSRDPLAIADRLSARATERYGAGRYAEAALLFQAALDLLRTRLPPTDETVRAARRDLSFALVGEGQLARAESLQRAEVELEDRIHGPALTRAMAREALALTLVYQRRLADAEPIEREALQLFRQGTAPGYWRVWSAARNLAFIVNARGRPHEALLLMDSAISIARLGPDSMSAGYLGAQRVPFLLRLNRLQDASFALEAAERALGSAPTVTRSHRADVHRYAGMVELAAGRNDVAVRRFRAALQLAEPPGDSTRQPNVSSCLLGVALARTGASAEARPLIAAGCGAYEKGFVDPLIASWIAAARKEIGSERPVARPTGP